MPKPVKAIPEGYHSITPFLSFKGASKAIQFYKKAFGAVEMECHHTEDGRVMYAALKIGDSMMMLADEFPEGSFGISAPENLKGTTALFHLYVNNADVAFDQAVAAGAQVKMPLADMFWGDRYGQLVDPFGHLWAIATHIADLSAAEIQTGSKECCNPSSCQK